MAIGEAEVDVSYGQIAVFNSGVERPFNDWTEEHVAQGFAWREGSVSFRTLCEGGLHRVVVALEPDLPDLPASTVRSIEVPFLVTSDENVEISGIVGSATFHIPEGQYQLRADLLDGSNQYDGVVRFVFAPGATKLFQIVLADPALNPPSQLITSALPA